MKSTEVYNAVRNIPEVTETQAYELAEIIVSSDKATTNMATKEDLNRMATKEDLGRLEANMATKEDLSRMATKEDLNRMATKEDLNRMATKEDLNRMATKEDLNLVLTKMNEIKTGLTKDIELAKAELRALIWKNTVITIGVVVTLVEGLRFIN